MVPPETIWLAPLATVVETDEAQVGDRAEVGRAQMGGQFVVKRPWTRGTGRKPETESEPTKK